MTLQADVQALVDQVAANTSAVNSAVDALKTEGDQIAALETQVNDLKTQLATGKRIDAEDLAAIQATVATLKETNTALVTAVPANTLTPVPPVQEPQPAPSPFSTLPTDAPSA